MVAGLSYSDCCTTTPSKTLLISHGLGGRPLQVESYSFLRLIIVAKSFVKFCFPSGWTSSVAWYPPDSIAQFLGFYTTPGRLHCSPYHILHVHVLYVLVWEEFVFRFRKLDIPVCTSNVSALANKLYLKNQVKTTEWLFTSFVSESNLIHCLIVTWKVEKLIRNTKFPALDTCTRACTTMGVMGMLTSKEECPTCANKVLMMPIRLFLCPTCPNKAVTLVFGKSITVSREVLAYPLLSLLAEVDLSARIHF